MTAVDSTSRLEALRRTGLLDSPREEAFDRLTRLASALLRAPIALVSLVEQDRQYFKSCVGLPEPFNTTRCTPIAYSFCQHVVESAEALVIPDTREHPLVGGNPSIAELGALAYAGIPLKTGDGHVLGTLCVLDVVPREWTGAEVSSLRDLAASVMTEITLRLQIAERAVLQRALEVERQRIGTLFEQAPAFIAWARGPNHVFEGANRAYHELVGFRDIIGKSVAEALPEAVEQGLVAALDRVLETREPFVADGMRLLLQRTKGGAPQARFVNFVYQPLVEADGTRSGIFCHGVDVTKQIEAAMTVRESDEHHRRVLDSLPVIVYRAEPTPPYSAIYVSAAVEALGYSREEWLERPDLWESRLHADDRVRVRREMIHTYTTAAPMDTEYRMHARDGSVRWFRDCGDLVPDEQGEHCVFQGIMLDITAQRVAEEALRESEARYRHIVANAPGMVYQFVYRPDGTKGYTFVSDGARAIFGVEPDAALRDSEALLGLIHPEERAQFSEQARRVAEEAGDFEWEGRVVLASGEERFIQVVARDQRKVDGTLLSDGLIVDITDRRRAAQRLEESEVRFRLAARATQDVLYDWNISADTHYWGESLLSGFGHAAQEVATTFDWWVQNIHADDAPHVVASVRAAMDGDGEAWSEEYRFCRGDGTYAQVLDRGYVLRDEQGTAIRMVGSMIDLTEHRELEEQFRQSQKMEAVGRLAGGVAHDFNNLLTVIKASTGFLLEELDTADPRREDARQIADAADRATGLTRQLLAFSRKQILDPRVLNVNAVVENLRPMLTRLIGEDVIVESVLPEQVGSIMADVGQLEQVLINLAVNARDAMPEGGRITIETAEVTLTERYAEGYARREHSVVVPGDYVMLVVSDTGTGMSLEVQARAFEPFYTTKAVDKGTGLGLSTVYGIVKQSGGHIWAYSEPGVGTVFKLYFPRLEAAAAIPLGRASEHPPRGSETVLLVEDEDALRRLARRMLERQGYTVLESSNGREALARATGYEGQIDLILTDIVMPEMSGRGLVERLSAVRPNAAVVYMSGYTDDDVLRRGLLIPGSRFLQKPFASDTLLRLVREALDG